jgi:hypothetical protein
MFRSRAVLLAVLFALAGLCAIPAPGSELKNVFFGPGRFMAGSMSKDGITTSVEGYVDTGVHAGMNSGAPYAGPLIEAVWGVVTVKRGAVQRTEEGLFDVMIEPAMGVATISGSINGVSIDVRMTATADPAPLVFTGDPGAITPPSFVFIGVGAGVTRAAALTGSASATGVGSIAGASGAGTIGTTAGVYVLYE